VGAFQIPFTSFNKRPWTFPLSLRTPGTAFAGGRHQSAGKNPSGNPVAAEGRLAAFALCHCGAH